MRLDVNQKSGQVPSKQSASTLAQNITSSSNMPGSVSGKSSLPISNIHEIGQEVEVHNLLIIDQHTFEGNGM